MLVAPPIFLPSGIWNKGLGCSYSLCVSFPGNAEGEYRSECLLNYFLYCTSKLYRAPELLYKVSPSFKGGYHQKTYTLILTSPLVDPVVLFGFP